MGTLLSMLRGGSNTSADDEKGGIDEEVVDELSVKFNFTHKEVRKLYQIFHAVDEDGSGHISREELLSLPQIQYNPLGQRVVAAAFEKREQQQKNLASNASRVFGSDKDLIAAMTRSSAAGGDSDELTFEDFVRVLSPFAPASKAEEKLKLAFRCYDFDGDGKLGRDDLTQLLKTLMPEEVEADLVEFAVDKVLEEADVDGAGFLSYEEYRKIVARSDLRAKLTINF